MDWADWALPAIRAAALYERKKLSKLIAWALQGASSVNKTTATTTSNNNILSQQITQQISQLLFLFFPFSFVSKMVSNKFSIASRDPDVTQNNTVLFRRRNRVKHQRKYKTILKKLFAIPGNSASRYFLLTCLSRWSFCILLCRNWKSRQQTFNLTSSYRNYTIEK